ncbi:MAG: CinA family protein [Albidovulum sp.]|nr:CinA family protein [Albidovulum sp.]
MTRDSARSLLSACRADNIRIAAAESCTGGLLSARITSVPGSSDYFDRGFVVYSNDAKCELLGVRRKTILEYGAVSENTAREMAEGALARSNADIAVSITGVAGPGASGKKPEGLVCFGISRIGAETLTESKNFGSIGREQVREKSVQHALHLLQSGAAAAGVP